MRGGGGGRAAGCRVARFVCVARAGRAGHNLCSHHCPPPSQHPTSIHSHTPTLHDHRASTRHTRTHTRPSTCHQFGEEREGLACPGGGLAPVLGHGVWSKGGFLDVCGAVAERGNDRVQKRGIMDNEGGKATVTLPPFFNTLFF